jgi:hypothetical protein
MAPTGSTSLLAHRDRSTKLTSLHNGYFNKQERGRASCDAAPQVSCPRRCRTGELYAMRALCTTADLRIGVELRNNEPPFVQGAKWHCTESACLKRMFQVFHRYVVSVLYRRCKSRSSCCTCCKDLTRMFQVYALNASSVPDVCCKCFIWMLQK